MPQAGHPLDAWPDTGTTVTIRADQAGYLLGHVSNLPSGHANGQPRSLVATGAGLPVGGHSGGHGQLR